MSKIHNSNNFFIGFIEMFSNDIAIEVKAIGKANIAFSEPKNNNIKDIEITAIEPYLIILYVSSSVFVII
ncbi:MAG: hypothetical protein ACRCYE_15115 [Sarcina sp.]